MLSTNAEHDLTAKQQPPCTSNVLVHHIHQTTSAMLVLCLQVKDRTLVATRMREHVHSADSTPLVVFPEGTCVNNEWVSASTDHIDCYHTRGRGTYRIPCLTCCSAWHCTSWTGSLRSLPLSTRHQHEPSVVPACIQAACVWPLVQTAGPNFDWRVWHVSNFMHSTGTGTA